ncbi:PD-(D/E)XK nuclease-like domain-containing protein [Salinarimonas sp. NSM]|uniref:PD-(D/E)XK nuclease-like domain-containing protein n=1 Tax=Salinarimonas sp. NSM TaxID=3458003 RepID=UPI004036FCAB
MNAPLAHPLSGARILAAGEVITEPGVYGSVPMERYHGADLCDGPSVSSSGLRTLFSQSPAHYFATSPLNPNRVERTETQAFSLGRAAHHLLLGEADFARHFAVRPDEWKDWRTNAAKAWRDEQEAAGLTVLKPDDLDAIRGMAASLAANPLVAAGILNGAIEQSIVWKDAGTGLWLKVRPDAIPGDGNDVADLKTTTSVAYDALAKTVAEYGYAMQGALIREGFRQVLGRDLETFSLVFVEKTAPWCCRIVTLKTEDLDLGADAIRVALRVFARCLERGEWPGPGGTQGDAEFLEIPEWARNRVRMQIEALKMEAA